MILCEKFGTLRHKQRQPKRRIQARSLQKAIPLPVAVNSRRPTFRAKPPRGRAVRDVMRGRVHHTTMVLVSTTSAESHNHRSPHHQARQGVFAQSRQTHVLVQYTDRPPPAFFVLPQHAYESVAFLVYRYRLSTSTHKPAHSIWVQHQPAVS